MLQQLADASSSLASTQALMSYTLIVLAVGTLVCLGLLVRLKVDMHHQTTASRVLAQYHQETRNILSDITAMAQTIAAQNHEVLRRLDDQR
jgi:hypothetical protein